jgi:hypothetical protein
VSIEAVPTTETPRELTHEEMIAAIKTKIENGELDPLDLQIETFLFMHEMKQVMTALSTGKMGGFLGKMLGRNGGD